MGLGLAFTEGEGPRFERPLVDEAAISRLAAPDPSRLAYVYDAVRVDQARALAGSVPLIGFAGSPFTLACYMIEGAGSADFGRVRRMLYARPDLLHRGAGDQCRGGRPPYLSAAGRCTARTCVMIFDTWGGLLAADAYDTFSLVLHQGGPRAYSAIKDCRVPTIVSSPRAAGNGWTASPPAVATPWARLDDGYRCRQAPGGSDALRYRAISTRWFY